MGGSVWEGSWIREAAPLSIGSRSSRLSRWIKGVGRCHRLGCLVVVTHVSRFDAFWPLIGQLEFSDRYDRNQLLTPSFRLGTDGKVEIYYAPFDHINTRARIALVGVTPGWTQMHRSFVVARAQMEKGADEQQILREVKRLAAFSGPLRKNLVSMLDGIGLSDALGVESSSILFESQGEELVHSTSAIRYPVFNSGENYSGRNPFITNTPLFAEYLEGFAQELAAVPGALVVPLGKAVAAVLSRFIEADRIDSSRVMLGFPHPSGANPHRLRLYAESRGELSRKVAAWANESDAGNRS
jgi:hypothetical protein